MSQPINKRVGTISNENILMLISDFSERGEVTLSDTCGNFHVGVKVFFHSFCEENVSGGDFSHQELDDDEEFLDGDAEGEAVVNEEGLVWKWGATFVACDRISPGVLRRLPQGLR